MSSSRSFDFAILIISVSTTLAVKRLTAAINKNDYVKEKIYSLSRKMTFQKLQISEKFQKLKK